MGPCQGFQDETSYDNSIQQVQHLLKGNVKLVVQDLKQKMKAEAGVMDFEKAEFTKRKIEQLENYQTKSVVYTKSLTPIDVFSIAYDQEQAYVSYLMIKDGKIIQTHILPLSVPLEEDKETILAFAIHHFRNNMHSTAQEIVVPIELTEKEPNVKYTIPKAGDKEQLLALSQKKCRLRFKRLEV